MILLCTIMLAAPPDLDGALRNLETRDARAKGRQEKSLEAVEKVLKATPARCPELEPQPCPLCSEPAASMPIEPVPPPALQRSMTGAWVVAAVIAIVAFSAGAVVGRSL